MGLVLSALLGAFDYTYMHYKSRLQMNPNVMEITLNGIVYALHDAGPVSGSIFQMLYLSVPHLMAVHV